MYAVLLVHFVSTLASLLKKNNKLSRGATASLMSSAERNVKGRGTVRYRGSSSGSRSESDTPPHWRTELNKTKFYKRNSEDELRDRWIKGDKLKYYDSYDSRSERKGKSGSDDDYQRRSKSTRHHKKYRSRFYEGSRGGRSRDGSRDRSRDGSRDRSRDRSKDGSRERSFSRSRRHSDERSRNNSQSSRATEESLYYNTRRRRRRRRRSEDSSSCSQKLQSYFSESEFEGYNENLKKSKKKSSRPSPTAAGDGDKTSRKKLRKKEKSSGKQEKHLRENWPKSKRLEDKGNDRSACDVRAADEQGLDSKANVHHVHCLSPVYLASVVSSSSSSSAAALDRSSRSGKSNVRINLSKARQSSSVENQMDENRAVSSESERSQQSSRELLRSSNKFQYFGETEAQKSRSAHDEESCVYKSRSSCSTKEGHRKSRDINKVKYSDYLQDPSSSESRKSQRLTLNTSDKTIVIKKASKERHRNQQIGLGHLKSDDRIKYLDENDPFYCGNSDASSRADGKAVQSSDRHIVEIPSSNGDEEARRDLPTKRMKYASDEVDNATGDSGKKFYSSKTSKADRYSRKISLREQEKIVAYSNISERSRSSSSNSKSKSLLEEEKRQLGRRIRCSEGNAQGTSFAQKHSDEWKVEKQNAASNSASKENSRDASQQSRARPLASLKRKYRRSESQSPSGGSEEEASAVHSSSRISYFKGNRSPSTCSLSSGHRSLSLLGKRRRRRSSGRRRSSSSSGSPERSKRPSRCRSSQSISRIRSSSRSKSWKSSRSRERSFTSETFSSRSLRSDSKSKQKKGDQSKTQCPPNLCDSSSVNIARMTTTASTPSFVASSAVQSLSDSPPPSRWKPGQKPWQPKKVLQVSSSIQPVLVAEPCTGRAESFTCSSLSVPLAQTKRQCRDEKISEEHLEGFRDSRREGLRHISKPSYGRSSSASSSVERELPFSRRRQDRQADNTPGNHSARSDSRSGSFSEDGSASGSGKTQMSDNEMRRKVRCREWSSSDESERSCSTDRMSKQRSLTEYSCKTSHLGKTKKEISHDEPTTANFQKLETNRKKKSQVHQVFQWQPPVEPEDVTDAEEDEGEQTKDLSQLSICRRRRGRVRGAEDVYKYEARKSQTTESVGVLSTAEAKGEAEEASERSELEEMATSQTATDADEIDRSLMMASDATAAAVTEDDNNDRSFLSVMEEERDQKHSFNIAADELNVNASGDLDTVGDGAFTLKDSLPIQSNFEAKLETEDMKLLLKLKVEHEAEAAEEKSEVGIQLSNVTSDIGTSSVKPECKNSTADQTQMVFHPRNKILEDCSEVSNKASLFEMESDKYNSAVSQTASVNREAVSQTASVNRESDEAEVKSYLPRHQLLDASRSGSSKILKPSLNESRVLTKQLNFSWKSRSRLSASSRSTGPVKLNSPASPDISACVLSPGKHRDANEASSEASALVPSSSMKSPGEHTEQSAQLNLGQDLEPARTKNSVRDSPDDHKTDSVGRLHPDSRSSRASSSQSSSHCSEIYISSGSEDKSKKLRRQTITSRSPSVPLRSSHSPTVSRDRSYDRWRSRSNSRSSSSDRATGRRSSESTMSRGTATRSRSRPRDRNTRTSSRSDYSSSSRSRSGNRTSRSRSRSGRTRRYAERSRTRSRLRYSSQDYYSSSEDDSRSRSSRSSRSYRRHSKRKSSQSLSSASYRRGRGRRRRGSSRRSYRQSSSSN